MSRERSVSQSGWPLVYLTLGPFDKSSISWRIRTYNTIPNSSHPERRRDRPCEASATSISHGANSGRSDFWKMRGKTKTANLLSEGGFCLPPPMDEPQWMHLLPGAPRPAPEKHKHPERRLWPVRSTEATTCEGAFGNMAGDQLVVGRISLNGSHSAPDDKCTRQNQRQRRQHSD